MENSNDPTALEDAPSAQDSALEEDASGSSPAVPGDRRDSILGESSAKMPMVERDSIAILKGRIDSISQRLAFKEKLQLGYVYHSYPLQYYKSWKAEGNTLFSLLVNLRKRLSALEAQTSKSPQKP